MSDIRGRVETEYRDESNRSLTDTKIKGFSTLSNMLYDINAEESDSIQLENNKRRRATADGLGLIKIELGHQTNVSQVDPISEETVKYIGSVSNTSTHERDSKNEQMAGTALQSSHTL